MSIEYKGEFMKKLVLAFSICLLSSTSIAAPKFSAFAVDRLLYVTVLWDSCNLVSGSLNVSPLCAADRLTRNAAPICNADLIIRSTYMACQDLQEKPRVIIINLDDNNVDPYSFVLKLDYDGVVIPVMLKDRP